MAGCEILGFPGRDGSISLNESRHNTSNSLNTQGKRRNVK